MRDRTKASPLLLGLIGISLGLLILAIVFTVKAITAPSKPTTTTQTDPDKPRATLTLNKEFNFPVKNDKGEEITKLKFLIENAELRDRIVVKGQSATAVSGRTFLILNLKLTNGFKQSFNINTRDYIRLVVNDKENEQLAPDIHNDPAEVQAISTKYTRIGFPINISDKNLKLKVGEIAGDKTNIDLKFK